jgi:hypothetical protein
LQGLGKNGRKNSGFETALNICACRFTCTYKGVLKTINAYENTKWGSEE